MSSSNEMFVLFMSSVSFLRCRSKCHTVEYRLEGDEIRSLRYLYTYLHYTLKHRERETDRLSEESRFIGRTYRRRTAKLRLQNQPNSEPTTSRAYSE